MKEDSKKYYLTSLVLLVIGCVDLLRGFLHTFDVVSASKTFAKLDLSFARDNQLTLLGAFGISNILTGLIYILISRKAKNLSPYILTIIPISYIVGFIGLRVSGINATADFLGKYFMLFYLLVCIVTVGIYIYRTKKK
ncbi:MAG: hypothetical protein WCK31_02260 [bacterium]